MIQALINYIQNLGYWGYLVMFVVIFFESFPMTFFFPGDSLLFTSGFLASAGYFRLEFLFITFFTAGVIGYVFSYFFGQKIIKKFFTNPKSKIFKPKYIVYTHQFFEKYGAKTIIIGRFVPIVRSFGPALAGVADLTFKRFLSYNFIGGVFWVLGMTSLGFYLGRIIPGVEKYLTPIIILIIVVSFLPSVYDYIKSRSVPINE